MSATVWYHSTENLVSRLEMLLLLFLTGTGYSSLSPCTASSKLAHGRGCKNCLGLLHWADNSSMLYLMPETKAW